MNQKAESKCDPCRQAKKKCNPSDRQWDDSKKEKCERCHRASAECGPNLTQFESDETKRGKKRKTSQTVHCPAQPTRRLRRDSALPQPESSFHGHQNAGGAPCVAAPSLAFNDGNHQPSPLPYTMQEGIPVDIYSMLEKVYKLQSKYQYMIHPNQTVSFLEQDSTFPTDAVRTQKEVTDYLAWIAGDVLADLVRNIDKAQDSAEWNLLLVQEATERFRRLTNDSERFLRVELEILEKMIYVVQHGSPYGLEQRDTSSVGGKGRPFHQQALEMEKKEMDRLLNSCSRSISPETGSTASGDSLESARQAINQASRLVFSEETTNSTDKQRSPSTSHVSRYIASKSCVKHRRKMLQDDKEFPKLHRAILYSTDHEVQSLFELNDASWKCVDFFKRTIGHIAAEEGRVHLLEDILLEQKKTFDTRDAFNLTPPMIAVMHGHLDSFRLLIEAEYDRELRDSSGRNLLSIACRRGQYHIVRYLVNDLEFPVNDDRGGYNCSPIHDAIESGNLETCRFLADFGADLITPFKGKLPRDLALEKAQHPILDLIKKKAEDALVAAENSSGVLPPLTGFPSGSIPRYGMVNNSDHLVHQPYPLSHQMPDMTPYPTDTFGYQYTTYQNLDNQLHAPRWNG